MTLVNTGISCLDPEDVASWLRLFDVKVRVVGRWIYGETSEDACRAAFVARDYGYVVFDYVCDCIEVKEEKTMVKVGCTQEALEAFMEIEAQKLKAEMKKAQREDKEYKIRKRENDRRNKRTAKRWAMAQWEE